MQIKTVLVIEDSLPIRENACELLELEGYKVMLAENGKKGLALAIEHLPDIILCDIQMPEATGYEVFNSLKANAATAVIPFIFLTSSVEKKDIEAGFGMGANGYIGKPFDMDELFSTITRCVATE